MRAFLTAVILMVGCVGANAGANEEFARFVKVVDSAAGTTVADEYCLNDKLCSGTVVGIGEADITLTGKSLPMITTFPKGGAANQMIFCAIVVAFLTGMDTTSAGATAGAMIAEAQASPGNSAIDNVFGAYLNVREDDSGVINCTGWRTAPRNE